MKKSYVILVTFLMAGYWIATTAQTLPRAGELIITEIMANPEAVSDANGEWVEIFNSSDHAVIVNGLIIKDEGSNKHTIASSPDLIIQPGAYWVLVKNKDTAANGGVQGNYQYSNFTLANTADQVILCLSDETVIDAVAYETGWPLNSGASMELHPDFVHATANDLPFNWFPARISYGAGDKGSPGHPNPVIMGGSPIVTTAAVEIFPNPNSGYFMLDAKFHRATSGEIRLANMIGQNFTCMSFKNKFQIHEVIEAGFISPGIWFVQVVTADQILTTRLVIEK